MSNQKPTGITATRIRFLLAMIVLAGGAARLQYAKSHGELQLIKKALPIRKPLTDMDLKVLAPWTGTGARMRPDTAEELGTSEYALWNLQKPGEKGVAAATVLFLTYYTGVQDQVPHVPEECHQVAGSDLETEVELTDVELGGQKGSVRKLTFLPTPKEMQDGDVGRKYVYYLIGVNGELLASRNTVRIRMADPRDSHLYYSKVELTFHSDAPIEDSRLDRVAIDLLDRTVTELFKSHWPPKGAERGNGEGAGK